LGQLDKPPAAETWEQLLKLARTEPSPDVRMQLASSCQRWRRQQRDPRDLLQELMQRSEDAQDPVIPLLIWIAYEPGVLQQNAEGFSWLTQQAADHPLVREAILPRVLRRLTATEEKSHLEAALQILVQLKASPATLVPALDGLLTGLRGRRLEPTAAWEQAYLQLQEVADEAARRRVHQLGVHFGNRDAVASFEREIADGKGAVGQRRQAIQALALARMPTSVQPLLALALGDAAPRDLRTEALRALASFDGEQVPGSLLAEWPKLPAELRKEVILVLSGRAAWANALMDAVQKGTDKPGGLTRQELTENDIRRLRGGRAVDQAPQAAGGAARRPPGGPGGVREELHGLPQTARQGA
jgi:hypothetical protein